MKRVLAAIVLVLGGCGNLLGLPEYRATESKPEGGPSSGGSDEGFLAGPACESCIQLECGSQADACSADSTCAALRSCRAACRDPICHEKCAEKLSLRGPSVPALSDLHTCVRTECVEACRPGRHWDCVCKYSPPSGYAEREIDLAFSLDTFGGSAPPHFHVRACPVGDLNCERPLASTETGLGQFILTVPSGAQGFAGSLLVTSAEQDAGASTTVLPTMNFESIPYTPRVAHFIGIELVDVVKLYLDSASETFDPTRAYSSVFPIDCQDMPGANLVVEASAADARTHAFYWRNGLPTLDADRTDAVPFGGLVIASLLAPVATELIARDADSGAAVAAIRVATTPGGYVIARMFPLTREDGCRE